MRLLRGVLAIGSADVSDIVWILGTLVVQKSERGGQFFLHMVISPGSRGLRPIFSPQPMGPYLLYAEEVRPTAVRWIRSFLVGRREGNDRMV